MIAGIIWLVSNSNGMLSPNGKPIGTDFSQVYAAGQMANEGRAVLVWDWPTHFKAQDQIFGPNLEVHYGWHYPPFFLFIASFLALFPYAVALFVWQAASYTGYVYSLRAVVGEIPGWIWPVLAFPAVYVNFTHGHNGFLTATLFGLACMMLDKRPIMAGIFIGCLAYKPHFGFLIPLALLVGTYYRAFFSASLTVIALCLLSTLVFGIGIWPAFLESLTLSRDIVLETGDTGWFKIQSAFSAIMMWTGSKTLAYTAQGLLAVYVTATIVLAFYRKVTSEDKFALLMIGSLLFTPYLLDYDLVLMAPAIAFLAVRGLRDGFKSYEVSCLFLAWFAPLLTRPLMKVTGIPLGFLAAFALFVIVSRIVWTRKAHSN